MKLFIPILCVFLLGLLTIPDLDSNLLQYFAFGQNDVVEGYLNIFHGHLEDGTSLYEFHLFDFDTFSNPPIILELSNNISIKELLELTGKNVIVQGTIVETSASPSFKRMNAVSILPSGTSITVNPLGPTVELDQKKYSWTDKVHITIVAQQFNLDPNLEETIGNSPNPIKISTRGSSLNNYILHENGTNTGIFTGEVILTGFLHDADGNPNTGDGHGNDVISTGPSGSGPTDGLLPADDVDGITVSFEFSEDETVTGSASIRWNIGEVQWLQPTYPSDGTGVVRITDPDMNLDPNAFDNFDVDVWSDSDSGGIDLTVTETGDATGIFEGTVLFTILNESSGHRLRVAEGDTVNAEYEDNTLPDPYTTADELDITVTSFIGTVVPPLERAPASNCRVVDAFGNALSSVTVNQHVQVTCDIASGQQIEQSFAFLIEVKDQNDDKSLSWITGSLSAGQSFSPALSWIPNTAGEFEITAFVWESVDNPTSISPPQNFSITVNLNGDIGFNSDSPYNTNGNIVRAMYRESNYSFESYQLLYDSFHDESKFVFTTHGREDPNGTGTLSQFNSLVIPLKFKNLDNEPHNSSYYNERFFGTADSVASYFRENSYGKFNLSGEVLDWQYLPNDMEYYFKADNLNESLTASDAVKLIVRDYSFKGRDGIRQVLDETDLQKDGDVGDDIVQLTFITNYNRASDQDANKRTVASAYLHPQKVTTSEGIFHVLQSFLKDNGDGFPLGIAYQKGYGAAAHELGHNFNWYHTPLLRPHDTHSDPWSLLSGINDNMSPPGVVAFQKKKAHWIESQDIMQVPRGQSSLVNLDYLSNTSPSSEKYLMVEIPIGSDGKFYTVEARKESRFDHIPGQFGLMVYEFNPDRSARDTERFIDSYATLSAAKSDKLDCTDWDGELCLNANYDDLSVTMEEPFNDTPNNISIKLVSISNESMAVCISNNIDHSVPKILLEPHYTEATNSLNLHIEFWDCFTGELISNVEYDLSVIQNAESVFDENNLEDNDGIVDYQIGQLPRTVSQTNSVLVNVELHVNSVTQNTVTENVRVVPEFESLAIVVLFISIITVIALTSKSKLSLVSVHK